MATTQTSNYDFFRHYPINMFLFYTEGAREFCTEYIFSKVPSKTKIPIETIRNKVQQIILQDWTMNLFSPFVSVNFANFCAEIIRRYRIQTTLFIQHVPADHFQTQVSKWLEQRRHEYAEENGIALEIRPIPIKIIHN